MRQSTSYSCPGMSLNTEQELRSACLKRCGPSVCEESFAVVAELWCWSFGLRLLLLTRFVRWLRLMPTGGRVLE
jgi:hypothetical protein